MKQLLAVLAILLLAGRLSGQQEPSADLSSLLAAAKQAQAANDYVTAALHYKQAVQLRPDVPELWANLGLMDHQAGNYPEAIHSFQEAIRLNPSLYVPNLFLGVDYLQTRRAKEAIPLLLKAQKMNATDPLPAMTLGRAYSSLGEYGSATRELRLAAHLDPKQGSTWFYLGIAQLRTVEVNARAIAEADAESAYAKSLYADSLIKQSRYNQAEKLYQSILITSDRPPCMASEAGFLHLKQGDLPAAKAQFEAEGIQHPECSLALLGKARLSIESGSSQEALPQIEQLWTRDRGFVSSNIQTLFDGMAHEQLQGFLDYLEQHQSSPGLEPELYATLTQSRSGAPAEAAATRSAVAPHLAKSFVANESRQARQDYLAGHYERCAKSMGGALEGSDPAALELLATCSFFTGDYALTSDAAAALQSLPGHHRTEALYWSVRANEKLAFASLEQYQQLEPDSARSHILLGDIYRQGERYDDAQKEYQKALEISPEDPAALLGLASAYYGDANVAKTIETAQRALLKSPDDPEINLLMGEALISQHKFTDAEPFLVASLNTKPQMLPHIHALLGEAYAEDGKTQDAIRELKSGAESDQDGSVHYRLARLYSKIGDAADAATAIQQMKDLQQKRREGAVIAVEDAHPAGANDSQ